MGSGLADRLLEAAARRAAEQRLADTEAELIRLRAEVARLRGKTPLGGEPREQSCDSEGNSEPSRED